MPCRRLAPRRIALRDIKTHRGRQRLGVVVAGRGCGSLAILEFSNR